MKSFGVALIIVLSCVFGRVVAEQSDREAIVHVQIETGHGNIIVALDRKKAPASVENFLTYMRSGHYNRTLIHRVVPGFVIQGGGYSKYFRLRAVREPVAYEGDNGLKNIRGTIAMARGVHRDSADAQWYINLRDNSDLDHRIFENAPLYGYTVFGHVISGMDVADAIGAVATGPGGEFETEAPLEPIIVTRIDFTQ